MQPLQGTLKVQELGSRLAGRWGSDWGVLARGNGHSAKASK